MSDMFCIHPQPFLLFKQESRNHETKKIGIGCGNRSNRPDVFCKKGVLRIFGKSTGKHLCQSRFLIKFQA